MWIYSFCSPILNDLYTYNFYEFLLNIQSDITKAYMYKHFTNVDKLKIT